MRRDDLSVRQAQDWTRFGERIVRNAEEPSIHGIVALPARGIEESPPRRVEELPPRRVEELPPRRLEESPPRMLPDKFVIRAQDADLWTPEDLKGYREILTLDSPNVHPEERKALLREAGRRRGKTRPDPNRPQYFTFIRDERQVCQDNQGVRRKLTYLIASAAPWNACRRNGSRS